MRKVKRPKTRSRVLRQKPTLVVPSEIIDDLKNAQDRIRLIAKLVDTYKSATFNIVNSELSKRDKALASKSKEINKRIDKLSIACSLSYETHCVLSKRVADLEEMAKFVAHAFQLISGFRAQQQEKK